MSETLDLTLSQGDLRDRLRLARACGATSVTLRCSVPEALDMVENLYRREATVVRFRDAGEAFVQRAHELLAAQERERRRDAVLSIFLLAVAMIWAALA